MSGWIAGAGLAGSVLATGASLYGQSQQQGYQGAQLAQAQANYALQQRIADEQQRMARAGREDALGNRVYFDGTNWRTDVTPATKGVLLASQANERNQQVEGGIRRDIGQRANFNARANAGNLADAVLREFQARAGAPSFEGQRGADVVAASTKAGSTRDTLADTLARSLIRTGGNMDPGRRAYDTINNAGADNLRTGIADTEANARDKFTNSKQAYDTAMLNKYAPLQAIRSNISDTAVAPSTIGAPIDAAENQAATYGAATSGRGGTGLNAGAAITAGVPQSPINYGGAIGSLASNVMAYLRSKQGSSNPPWNEDSRNPAAYNNWSF